MKTINELTAEEILEITNKISQIVKKEIPEQEKFVLLSVNKSNEFVCLTDMEILRVPGALVGAANAIVEKFQEKLKEQQNG